MEIKKIEKSDFVMFFDERSGKAERPRMQHRGLEFGHVEPDAFKAELRHVEGLVTTGWYISSQSHM